MNDKRCQISLRTFLLLAGLLVPLVYFGHFGWSTYRHYADLWELTAMFRANGLGIEKPIYDGQVILIRKGNVVGAFIPSEQSVDGESLKYRWYYRADGHGRFDDHADAIVTGTGSAKKNKDPVYVAFGPFSFEWSMSKQGWGWIYYDSDDVLRPQRFCLTNASTINGLDAYDPRWVYKASATDDGFPGNAKR